MDIRPRPTSGKRVRQRIAHHPFRAEDDLNRVLVIQQKRIFGQNIWRHWLGSPGCKLIAARIQLCDLYESTNRVPSEIAACVKHWMP